MELYLPISVTVNNKEYPIRNKCDFRIVIQTLQCINDKDLDKENQVKCALYNFYQEIYDKINLNEDIPNAITEWEITKLDIALCDEMMNIINIYENVDDSEPQKPKVLDWEHDYNEITSAVSAVVGYSVRDKNNYTHWFDFIGAFNNIRPECSWANIISVRLKKMKGKKLEKYEQEFYNENRKKINLPVDISSEEQEWLDSDW